MESAKDASKREEVPVDEPSTDIAPKPTPLPVPGSAGTVVRAASPNFFLMIFLVCLAAAILGSLLAGYLSARYLS